jgi:predicted Holliday junction resolvase-like endonuclease
MLYTILILIIIASTYAIVNLLRKLEKLEDFIDTELQRNEALLEALRQIDNRQMFEKDDEVGSVFLKIKETIERFKQFNNNA